MYTLVEIYTDALAEINCIKEYNDIIGLDTETTGLSCFTDNIVLVQVLLGDRKIIFDIRKLGYSFLKELTEVLNTKKCVLHNAKFDMKFLYNRTGIWLNNVHCTLICESVLNAGRDGVPLALGNLVEKYCGEIMSKDTRMDFVNLPETSPITMQMLSYSALDVAFLVEIYNAQMALTIDAKEEAIIDMEMQLVPVVAQMEYTGIKLDVEAWKKLEATNRAIMQNLIGEFKDYVIDQLIVKLTPQNLTALGFAELLKVPVYTKKLRVALETLTDISNIRNWLKENFNVGSPTQMKAVLNLMGVKVDNTNEKTLFPHADKPVITKLLAIREVAKQVSTYGLKVLENVNPITGRIHTDYFTGGTRTGRFSSRNPNLQNMPSHGGFRECFVPEDGYSFCSVDYSQQEYRLAGAISKEDVIIDAYINGSDMHTATASIQFGIPLSKVTKDQRNIGKTMNFAILYGSSEWGLHKNLKVPVEKAKQMIAKFFAGYPKLEAFKKLAENKILELGYSCTPMGRRRYNVPKPMFADSRGFVNWQDQVKREGFNIIIQGGGADIIKLAMINIAKKNPWGDKFRMLLQIHDELLVEVHNSIKDEALKFIETEMMNAEQPFLGRIPAVVEGRITTRWEK